jgi:hypothetical protein
MHRQLYADLFRALMFLFCTLVFPGLIKQRVVSFGSLLCSHEMWSELLLTAFMLTMAAIALNELRSILAVWQWAMQRAPRNVLALPHVESLVDHCTDPISLDVLDRPIILSCGHAVNEQSLAILRRLSSPMQCPVCKQTVQFQCHCFALQNVVGVVKILKDFYGIESGRSY